MILTLDSDKQYVESCTIFEQRNRFQNDWMDVSGDRETGCPVIQITVSTRSDQAFLKGVYIVCVRV